jgi:hypothetical protein
VQVFLFREYIKTYPTQKVFWSHYRITDEMTLIRYVRRVLLAYNDYFSAMCIIKWPSDEELSPTNDKFEKLWQGMIDTGVVKEEEMELLRKCVTIIDGTEIRISRPSKSDEVQKSHYSGKKKTHSLSAQVIVHIVTGECLYASDVQNIHNDQQQWNLLNIRSKFLSKNYGLLADGGYTPNLVSTPKDQRIFAAKPYKKAKKSKLTEEEKTFNKTLSQHRVLVENFFSRVKRFAILSSEFRHYFAGANPMIDISIVFRVICSLVNWDLKLEPLRKEKGWQPKFFKNNNNKSTLNTNNKKKIFTTK